MSSSPPHNSTRTVAILKPSAVKHRLTIEPRIIEAGFEIVKERQMEFHPDGDRLLLQDLFGHDTKSLTSGPVWVYVLERRRAVEVLLTLMGHDDPEAARGDSPKSLRAVYGRDRDENAIYGSPSEAVAERQIATLFASSPPFRAADIPLPSSESEFGLEHTPPVTPQAKYRVLSTSDALRSPSSSVSSKPTPSKRGFKARAAPATTAAPASHPRTNRAAALRAGLDVPPPPPRAKREPSAEADAETFADVPGHKFRSTRISVASCAPPASQPRQTRASALRTGQGSVGATPVRERVPVNFEGTPGHKRSESFNIASIKAPSMAPRLNRSAALRALGGGAVAAPPSAFRDRTSSLIATPPVRPSLSRPSSTSNFATTPTRGPPRPSSTVSLSPSRPSPSRPTIAAPPSSFRAPIDSGPVLAPARPSTADGKRPPLNTRSSTSSLASASRETSVARPASLTRPPSITPRTNRSALLRASMQPPAAQKPVASPPKVKKTDNRAPVIAV